jgi:hypothetical protein
LRFCSTGGDVGGGFHRDGGYQMQRTGYRVICESGVSTVMPW